MTLGDNLVENYDDHMLNRKGHKFGQGFAGVLCLNCLLSIPEVRLVLMSRDNVSAVWNEKKRCFS